MSKRRKGREIVLQAIYQYELGNNNLEDIIQFKWIHKKIPEDISLFAKEIIIGTINNIDFVDNVINEKLENWNLNNIAIIDKCILRFSIYSLIFQKDIPKNVIINEAIDIARKFGNEKSYQFINGILDAIR